MKTPVSIVLFFLLSAFFLFALLAALERSRKASAIAAACLVAVVCTIVFLTPVRLPSWLPINEKEGHQRFPSDVTITKEFHVTTTTLEETTPVMDSTPGISTTGVTR